MKYKKFLILLGSLLFFLAALTFYLNRVIFPQWVKKIAAEQIEKALKRKVEIDTIHFNWVRGIIIDRIKIYEKDSAQAVFAQAQQVSFGFILIPSFKHYKITIPFIHVLSPSVHLIRNTVDSWNFSDMLPPPPSTAQGSPPKPSDFEIAWGGITISDGKFLLDDVSVDRPWSELFDNINLKLSLSYKGIDYNFTADIPAKKGFVGATVYYQPITKNTRAQIHLKNIDTASYLSLVKIPDIQLKSGIIKKIDLDIDYSQDKTSAQGEVIMSDLDMTSHDQAFKGNIEIRDLNAQYKNGNIKARGQMSLGQIQTKVPGLSAGGNVQTRVNTFELTPEGMVFDGSFHAQSVFLNLTDRFARVDNLGLDNIKLRKDKDGLQTVGSISALGLIVAYSHQTFKSDITLKPLTVHMKDENNVTLEGDLLAQNFSTNLGDKAFNSQRIHLEDLKLLLTDQKNISMSTRMSLNNMELSLGSGLTVSGSLKADKLLLKLADGILDISTALIASQGHLVLDGHKTIDANPQLELSLQVPLNAVDQMTYKGSITFSDASIRGFPLVESIDNAELDADFKTDTATINALGANILDTNVRINGTVKNFKNPLLDINVEAEELNLSKIKNLAPKIVDQYGLTFDGTSSVKVKFEGLALKPLSGNIRATASVKNVSVASSKYHQKIKNVTGIIEATPDSLVWRDFTATYLGKPYSLTGSLDNFNNPKIFTILNGEDIQLKGDIIKAGNLITINGLTGKYLNAAFDTKGTITLREQDPPQIDIKSRVSVRLEDLINVLPPAQKKNIQPLSPSGTIALTADLKGTGLDWKNYTLTANITSPVISLLNYKLNDISINISQDEGKIKNLTLDGKLYEGTVHALASADLTASGMPYDLAFNIDNTDLHELKIDSPLKMEEINGKFYFTSIVNGTIADFKNTVHGKGSLAIREGFLAEFNLFKGLLGILNEAMRLGQVMITDVESNFTIENQKISTDNLRLKGPTIVLLGKGWVNFDQYCDLNMTVDLSSGVVPPIAQDVLQTLNIHIYDKIANPKFKKKISVPQVLNTLLKNFLQ
ncbi:MAG: hypothetical protein HQL14_06625 [Candidatus Omnitrophica bacterium]|nr:hypothetical protein [Candidatus Omnitrophota bacterium]